MKRTVKEIERDTERRILKAREQQIYMESKNGPTEEILEELESIKKRAEELRKDENS